MSIEISTQIIHNSYAAVINKIDHKANIYDNPNQQGTAYPAWFIVHRSPVEVAREFGKRMNGNCYMLTYQIDIWYMIQQNIPRLYDQYTAIAERFDSEIEYLPIFGSDAIVHVYDRSWSLELNAMKYSTTLKLRVFADKNFAFTPIEVIEDLSVFLKNQNQSVITFENTTHPEFDAQIPSPISVTKGQPINLPFVGGEFEDEDYKWTPSGWSIGAFGARIRLDESITTNLLWSSTEKTATLSFENTTHPEFSVQMPESITANKGTSVELPSVSGTFPVGSVDWTPSAWSVGAFGDSFILDEDTTTDLQWSSKEVQFTISFSNSNHPEFDVDLPQTELITRGDSVTLPSVSGSFIVDGYEWTPDSWDIGAFGDSYTPSSDVIANLLWRSQEYHPTMPTVEDCGIKVPSSSTSYTATQTLQPQQVSRWLYWGGSNPITKSNDDNANKTFAISKLMNSDSTTVITRIGASAIWDNTDGGSTTSSTFNLSVQNIGTSEYTFSRAYIYSCYSLDATIIVVYDSNNNAFNAFKYTSNGTDYYYVLDDVQTDWTDDLESIGYYLGPTITLYMRSGNKTIDPNVTNNKGISGGWPVYADSAVTTPYYWDFTKRYERGWYHSETGKWTASSVQTQADMPSTTGGSVYLTCPVSTDQIYFGMNGSGSSYYTMTELTNYFRVYDDAITVWVNPDHSNSVIASTQTYISDVDWDDSVTYKVLYFLQNASTNPTGTSTAQNRLQYVSFENSGGKVAVKLTLGSYNSITIAKIVFYAKKASL